MKAQSKQFIFLSYICNKKYPIAIRGKCKALKIHIIFFAFS